MNNFTFPRSQNRQFPPFKFNYVFLNKNSDFKILNNNICQIVNQEQELVSEHNITHQLYQHFINLSTNLKQLFFVIDTSRFKLKFENNYEDKPFVEDKGLNHIIDYKTLLSRIFKKNNIYKLPISIKKSGNYLIQKIALEYQSFSKKKVKFLAELFNFDTLYGQSPVWDMLIYFAKNTNATNYVEIIKSYLRTFIESDITKISQQFFDALKSKNFVYKKIIDWRLSQFQVQKR